MILFNTTTGPESRPVIRFLGVFFSDGAELDRLDLVLDWDSLGRADPESLGDGSVIISPRRGLGAIDGFLYRHAKRTAPRRRRRWGSFSRTSMTAQIAWDSPGDWRAVKALYRMFGKGCPWSLTRITVPPELLEELEL